MQYLKYFILQAHQSEQSHRSEQIKQIPYALNEFYRLEGSINLN